MKGTSGGNTEVYISEAYTVECLLMTGTHFEKCITGCFHRMKSCEHHSVDLYQPRWL